MLTRFLKLLVGLGLLGVLLYVVSVNKTLVTFKIYGDYALQDYSLGVMAIILFAAGVFAASLGGLVVSAPSYLRHRKVLAELKTAKSFHAKVADARSASAGHQWARARSLWEQLLKKDPSDVIAAAELSKVLEQMGEQRLALKELTAAKARSPRNIEILVRSAEVNIGLGNKTAAIDNLSQILALETNRYAAEWAMQLSEENGNHQDALEYLEIIESLGNVPVETSQRIRFSQLQEEIETLPSEEKKAKLKKFLRKYPKCTGAMKVLAVLEAEADNFNDSAKYLIQALKTKPSVSTIEHLVNLGKKFGKEEQVAKLILQAEQGSSLGTAGYVALAKNLMDLNKEEEANMILRKARTALDSQQEAGKVACIWEKELAILESLTALSSGNTDSAKTSLSSAM